MSKIYLKNNDAFTEATEVGINTNGTWDVSAISATFQKVDGVWTTNASLTSVTNCYFGGNIRILPYDAEIEYLESNGTQYIDCNYIPKGSDKIETKVRCTTTTFTYSTQTAYPLFNPIFGVQNSGSHCFWSAYVKNKKNSYYQFYYYNTYNNAVYCSYTPTMTSATVLNWYTFYYDGGDLYRDGNKLTPTATNNASSPSLLNSMYLFYVNTTGNSTPNINGNTSKLQIAYFKVFDSNNNLIRDFIPVRKGTTGYMYDKVSGELFGNSGTGDFILGPDKS